MPTSNIIEIIMASAMGVVLIGVFIRSWQSRNGTTTKTDSKNVTTVTTGKVGGIGARTIQFTCVGLIIPAIIILSLEGILKGETVATIIGGLIGYVLSGISNYDKADS